LIGIDGNEYCRQTDSEPGWWKPGRTSCAKILPEPQAEPVQR